MFNEKYNNFPMGVLAAVLVMLVVSAIINRPARPEDQADTYLVLYEARIFDPLVGKSREQRNSEYVSVSRGVYVSEEFFRQLITTEISDFSGASELAPGNIHVKILSFDIIDPEALTETTSPYDDV